MLTPCSHKVRRVGLCRPSAAVGALIGLGCSHGVAMLAGVLRVAIACLITSACTRADGLEAHEAALVGGTALCRNQLPAVVPWLTAAPGGGRGDGLICSATLIAPQVALTAAHCVDGAANHGVVIEGSLIGLDMLDAVARDGTTVVVQQASILAWDVALLKLATAVEDRPLIPLGRHWVVEPNSVGIAAGFGATSPAGGPVQARGPKRYLEGTLASYGENSLIFASAEGSLSHGDSGGPTLVQDGGTVYLVAIHYSLVDSERMHETLLITPETLAEIEAVVADWGLALPAASVGDDIATFEPCDPASNRDGDGGCSAGARPSLSLLGALGALGWATWRRRMFAVTAH